MTDDLTDTPLEAFDTPKRQPTCPACRSTDLKLEDVSSGRAQCNRCSWRLIINPNGTTRDWLNLAKAGNSRKRGRG